MRITTLMHSYRNRSDAEMPRNIALIGFMGSGKSTVGRALADRLEWTFVDTDTVISRDAGGRSIPELFTTEGEARFREREAVALSAACSGVSTIISTGGGAVLLEQNVAALTEASLVVWLTARPDVVLERTRRSAQDRPVLAPGTAENNDRSLLAHILTLLSHRAPYYQAASQLIVDSSDRAPRVIAAEIHRKAQQWASRMARTAVNADAPR